MNDMKSEEKSVVYSLAVDDDCFDFSSDISSALATAELQLQALEDIVSDNLETVKKLTPECDKLDYVLAATSGVICGVIDIFLVGKPGESPVGNITDKWFENRTKDFAKLCGWNDESSNLSSAIRHLEKKFKVPYDQRGMGDAASWIFDLNAKNHHFKSLSHNPSILGLFFSILDQFSNTSHFVSGGELLSLQDADGSFELKGNDVPSKIFCGFFNWFGHLISDVSGSSGSKGRGMGIPSSLWTWTNDVIAIKRKLNIPVSEFDKSVNELALKIYKEGYDVRFQIAQAIPVFINELIVRLMYSIRRLIKYYSTIPKDERSFSLLWRTCEPFSNSTVKRMLTVAHGTFCLVDIGDAVVRGIAAGAGSFNVAEFFMRINIVGVGRFTISLYGEVKRGLKKLEAEENAYFYNRKKVVVQDYIAGLYVLADIYDDKMLLTFVDDLKCSELYRHAFEKTILLAQKREVSEEKILKNKSDIDAYFIGGKN